jgi:hypothetical protein
VKLLLPAEHLAIESALPPKRVLDAIPDAVDECNRSAVLLGLRSEVDEDHALIGWWPRLAFVKGGIAFVGRAFRAGERTVVSGDVRLFPRWYGRLVATTLLLAGALPLVELRGPDRWVSILGAVWLFGGGRLALEVLFRAYRRRIVRVLRAAAGTTSRADVGR